MTDWQPWDGAADTLEHTPEAPPRRARKPAYDGPSLAELILPVKVTDRGPVLDLLAVLRAIAKTNRTYRAELTRLASDDQQPLAVRFLPAALAVSDETFDAVSTMARGTR